MRDDDDAPRHPIRVVAHRTGLTPATIRAWERRYGAVEPSRSQGGQRLYSDRDVMRLATLRALTEQGRSISSVASMSEREASALLAEDRRSTPPPAEPVADEAVDAYLVEAFERVRSLEESELERVLIRAALTLGARPFLERIAVPLLTRIGSAWEDGVISPAQEHMASGVLERVIMWLSDPSLAADDGPGLVVATLPGERHALGARLAATAAAFEGWRTTYLGPDLPESDIATAAAETGASVVAISVVRRDALEETTRSLATLRSLLDPGVGIIVGGSAALLLDPDRLPSGVEVLEGLGAFRQLRLNGRS